MKCIDCGSDTNLASKDGQFRCWRCHCKWLEGGDVVQPRQYPAALKFDLAPTDQHRKLVLAAAARLKLKVTLGEGSFFEVEVNDANEAYWFGREYRSEGSNG